MQNKKHRLIKTTWNVKITLMLTVKKLEKLRKMSCSKLNALPKK